MIRLLRASTTISIILILSLNFSLLPVEKTEVILPEEQTEFIYNVYGKRVELSSNFVIPIEINVSKIDRKDQKLEQKHQIILEGDLVLDFEKPGLYLFSILSPELVEITFMDSGIRTWIYVVGFLLLIVRTVIWFYEANLFSVDAFSLN